MIQDYRKVVGSRIGGIKFYAELKQGFINQDIKIGSYKRYDVLRLQNILVTKLKKVSDTHEL